MYGALRHYPDSSLSHLVLVIKLNILFHKKWHHKNDIIKNDIILGDPRNDMFIGIVSGKFDKGIRISLQITYMVQV